MLLNCDLGEGFDEVDRAVIPLIDLANIACGGHAGNDASIRKTLALAKRANIQVAAHPSYPDKQNFGRRSLAISQTDLLNALQHQCTTLQKHAKTQSMKLYCIKPHGALYNDCMTHIETLQTVIQLAKNFDLPLMLQALPDNSFVLQHAEKYAIKLLFEGFADRAYQDDGRLVPRTINEAVHSQADAILAQAKKLVFNKSVVSINGKQLRIAIDSLCVHGDSEHAIESIQKIRHAVV